MDRRLERQRRMSSLERRRKRRRARKGRKRARKGAVEGGCGAALGALPPLRREEKAVDSPLYSIPHFSFTRTAFPVRSLMKGFGLMGEDFSVRSEREKRGQSQ